MNNEEKIIQKLEEHDSRFDEHDRRLDLLASKAMEHDSRFDELATKKEFKEFKDQVLEGQDEMLTILKRLDEEAVSTAHAIARHDKKIIRIEEKLNIA